MLNDYLREFRTKLTARNRHRERVAATTQCDKPQADKEIEKIDKILNERRATTMRCSTPWRRSRSRSTWTTA
jgi:hypothetical protein